MLDLTFQKALWTSLRQLNSLFSYSQLLLTISIMHLSTHHVGARLFCRTIFPARQNKSAASAR